MSSLIFFADEKQALVATDTLATTLDGQPHMFTTKAFIVPHLRLITIATGVGRFLGRWFINVNDNFVVHGIDHLNDHAPAALLSLWQRYKEELSVPEEKTSTIYHLGFSEVTGLIHMYAYRSNKDFTSERLEPYGLRIKPEIQVPADYQLPRDFRTMMDEQRRVQASLPKSERIYVGGEIQVHHLTEQGFGVYTLHRFEDYARDETAIYHNFGR